jgi:hypothetical protein
VIKERYDEDAQHLPHTRSMRTRIALMRTVRKIDGEEDVGEGGREDVGRCGQR